MSPDKYMSTELFIDRFVADAPIWANFHRLLILEYDDLDGILYTK